jgi:RNA polymerase sigma-70 factor (ECF subfamily)
MSFGRVTEDASRSWLAPAGRVGEDDGRVVNALDRDRACRDLLDAFGPAIGRLARSYERDTGRAEDLEQDIWLAIWQALPRFRGDSSTRTFVYRVAHNRAVSHVIRWRRRRTDAIEAAAHVADVSRSPEESASERQRHDRLRHAVLGLPLSQRQVILLVLEGLTTREAAEVLGVAENAVAVRLTRARKTLRRLLEDGPGGVS